MRNIWTIARKEYQQYFSSPIAYVVAFVFLLILGWLFNQSLGGAILQATVQPAAPSVQIVLAPLVTLLLFTMPAITMRTLAEEQRLGTMELLLTAPVRDWELVIGKWLGALLFVYTLLLVSWIYPLLMNQIIDPGIDQGVLLSGYLGLLLIAASLVALGVAISSLFSNQVAAFFASFGLVLLLWIIQPISGAAGEGGSELVRYLNFLDHYLGFYRGVVDLQDVAYYLSLTALGLILGSISVESRRWRG